MSDNGLTFEEMKKRYEDLQRRAAHSLVISQNLIDAKGRLDRELSRFKTIQTYSEKAIHAGDFEEFSQLTVEAIIESFEIECSALLMFDSVRTSLIVKAEFGFEKLEVGQSLEVSWLSDKGYLKGRNAFIEKINSDDHPWAHLSLCQIIMCSFSDSEGDLKGFVLGGRTQENRAFYDEITRELIPSFMVFSQQMSTLLQNYESRKYLESIVHKRTEELRVTNVELITSNKDLELEIATRKRTEEKLRSAEQEAKELSEFLKKMFGRYLSTKVMNSLLENPSALELGGERRNVTIMMSDLRGFAVTTERLEPEQVVRMLNTYFEVMLDLVRKYSGTVNEIIGDSLLIIFGAPQEMPDRTERAIACAISMQNAMGKVNAKNRSMGLPDLAMGIGLHDSEVIVGNIGSSKRFKYSVVGSGVNLVSRIETYTIGGQILVSESVYKKAGRKLRVVSQREVLPKGFEMPLKIYEIGGIAGSYNLALKRTDSDMVSLAQKIPLRYAIVEGKDIEKKRRAGFIVRLSKMDAEVVLDEPVRQFSNIKMNLKNVFAELSTKDFYAKVIELSEQSSCSHLVRFTSVPLEIDSFFLAHRMHACVTSETKEQSR